MVIIIMWVDILSINVCHSPSSNNCHFFPSSCFWCPWKHRTQKYLWPILRWTMCSYFCTCIGQHFCICVFLFWNLQGASQVGMCTSQTGWAAQSKLSWIMCSYFLIFNFRHFCILIFQHFCICIFQHFSICILKFARGSGQPKLECAQAKLAELLSHGQGRLFLLHLCTTLPCCVLFICLFAKHNK